MGILADINQDEDCSWVFDENRKQVSIPTCETCLHKQNPRKIKDPYTSGATIVEVCKKSGLELYKNNIMSCIFHSKLEQNK